MIMSSGRAGAGTKAPDELRVGSAVADNQITLVSVRVKTAIRLTRLSPSKLYKLIASGDVGSAKVGYSRLVVFPSLHKLIDEVRCWYDDFGEKKCLVHYILCFMKGFEIHVKLISLTISKKQAF